MLKLCVFDCGKIDSVTAEEFGFEQGEIATEMTTPCYLIVHPEGSLMWDTGEIPDSEIELDGKVTRKRAFVSSRRLRDQLEEIDYAPEDIDLLALHETLEQLNTINERQAKLVELRYFGGLTNREAAQVLGVSLGTVENDWKVARLWLHRKLSRG